MGSLQLPAGGLEAELFHDLFHVFPDFGFLPGASQEVSGVKSGHDLYAFIIVHFAPYPGYSLLGVEEGLGGDVSQGADDLWFDGGDRLMEAPMAGRVWNWGCRRPPRLAVYRDRPKYPLIVGSACYRRQRARCRF